MRCLNRCLDLCLSSAGLNSRCFCCADHALFGCLVREDNSVHSVDVLSHVSCAVERYL